MNRIVAVSGGVDSVVLLDILARGNDNLIVAHVDHGIRDDSTDDARFVAALAKQYKLPFLSTKLALGSHASEDTARQARYAFLNSLAKEHNAEIFTAHHQDDLVESIAINLTRGTGWRGLCVLNRNGVYRPLLGWSKRRIYEYALNRKLEWVEDSTNGSTRYLRNRLRFKTKQLSTENIASLARRRTQQLITSREIDRQVAAILERIAGSRHFYTMVNEEVAVEILRAEISRYTIRPTAPDARRLLYAIKSTKPGGIVDISKHVRLRLTSTDFIVEVDPE